ncbi:MAG: class I SAM-dependent methyltransferase [Candidatus Kapaibacterium sp.]
MKPDLQRRVQRYGWDKAVDHYERCWREQLSVSHARLLEIADIQPGEEVADIACGTGIISFAAAAKAAPGGNVLGTDISGKMVERAAAVAGERNVKNISFARMDAEALELPEESFDVALSALGIMYYPSPVQGMKEMARILRPGGRAVVSTWGARTACGWAEIFPIVDRRVNTDVCPLFFQEGTGENLRLTLERAGFAEIRLDRISTTLHYGSFEDAANAAFVGGPVAMAYSRFDEQTRVETAEEYRASIEPYRVGEGYEIPGEFVIGSGRKPS